MKSSADLINKKKKEEKPVSSKTKTKKKNKNKKTKNKIKKHTRNSIDMGGRDHAFFAVTTFDISSMFARRAYSDLPGNLRTLSFYFKKKKKVENSQITAFFHTQREREE